MMRIAVFFLALSIASVASSNNPATALNIQAKSNQEPSAKYQAGTEQSPIVVKLLPSEVAQKEIENAHKETQQKIETDRQLVNYTGVLALIAFLQFGIFWYQGSQLKRSVDSSERASAPYVFPDLDEIDLYRNDSNHIPRLKIKLWNHGKTPAIMKQARFELHITDQLPGNPQFTKNATDFSSHEIISGEQPSSFDWEYKFYREISPTESEQLKKNIKDVPFKRVYLTGEIKYDDFFGYTHTIGCCFKLFHTNKYLVKNYPGYAYKDRERSRDKQTHQQNSEE